MTRTYTHSSSSTCQSYVDAVTWHSTITALSATYTICIYLAYAWRLKDRWESSPKVAAKFWFVAVAPKLCVALALFTVLVPTCPATCPCDTGTMYVYPSISLFLCAVWVARGFVLLKKARANGVGRGTGMPSATALDDEADHHILPAHAALKAPATTAVGDDNAGNRPRHSQTEMV
jgi:hypothetical protein